MIGFHETIRVLNELDTNTCYFENQLFYTIIVDWIKVGNIYSSMLVQYDYYDIYNYMAVEDLELLDKHNQLAKFVLNKSITNNMPYIAYKKLLRFLPKKSNGYHFKFHNSLYLCYKQFSCMVKYDGYYYSVNDELLSYTGDDRGFAKAIKRKFDDV